MTTEQLLREAASEALLTLDGIADTNPRDKTDFEAPAEWIAWAKSRARWAADALRAPIAQEIYAERILKQMLHESDPAQATQEPVQAGELPPLPEPAHRGPTGTGAYFNSFTADQMHAYARAALAARKPLTRKQINEASRDAQISFCLKTGGTYEEELARAIERAHGIGLEVKP